MRFILQPLPINILGMADIDDGGIVNTSLLPLTGVEGQIVVDQDTEPVADVLVGCLALVSCVTVIY